MTIGRFILLLCAVVALANIVAGAVSDGWFRWVNFGVAVWLSSQIGATWRLLWQR